MNTNEQLQDAYIRHAVYINRYASTLSKQIKKLLIEAEKDLNAKLAARLGDLSQIDNVAFMAGKSATTRRLKALTDTLKIYQTQYDDLLEKPLQTDLKGLAKAEQEHNLRTLDGATPIVYEFEGLTTTQLNSIVTSQPFQGRDLRKWSKDWGQARKKRVDEAIRIGMFSGETTQQITRRVRQQLEISRRSAETIARTAVAHVQNETARAVMEANKDVVAKEAYTAVLDRRTSGICRTRDGKTYGIGQGPFLPAHPNCRSIYIPVTRAARSRDKLKSGRTRASMNGQVPANLDYGDWWERQSAKYKRGDIGQSRYKIYKDGGLSFDDLYNSRNGRVWTLNELREKYPQAYKAAKL